MYLKAVRYRFGGKSLYDLLRNPTFSIQINFKIVLIFWNFVKVNLKSGKVKDWFLLIIELLQIVINKLKSNLIKLFHLYVTFNLNFV